METIFEYKQMSQKDPEAYPRFKTSEYQFFGADVTAETAYHIANWYTKAIEDAVFTKYKSRHGKRYSEKMRKIIKWVTSYKNRDFIYSILSGEVKIVDLPSMHSDEMIGKDLTKKIASTRTFKGQGLLTEDSLTVVSKSSRGEQVINIQMKPKKSQIEDNRQVKSDDPRAEIFPETNTKTNKKAHLLRPTEERIRTLDEAEQYYEKYFGSSNLSNQFDLEILKKAHEKIDNNPIFERVANLVIQAKQNIHDKNKKIEEWTTLKKDDLFNDMEPLSQSQKSYDPSNISTKAQKGSQYSQSSQSSSQRSNELTDTQSSNELTNTQSSNELTNTQCSNSSGDFPFLPPEPIVK